MPAAKMKLTPRCLDGRRTADICQHVGFACEGKPHDPLGSREVFNLQKVVFQGAFIHYDYLPVIVNQIADMRIVDLTDRFHRLGTQGR